ncbi:MAG: glycosyltransferase 87 family protein, partial [Candidatus Thorarchaeota archaeon]
ILQSKVTNVWRLKIPIALWFVTPLVIMTGAMHGKFDSLMFIFILAACYFYEKRKLFPEAIFLSLGILTKTIVLILVPFFLLRDIKERKFLNILYKIGLIVFPILLFSIPFLYDPIIYFQGILGVHITRGHDLAPLFALLSLPFSSEQADTIIRIILTVIIVLVWIGLIVLSYFKNWDIYASGFYAFLSFNFLYWVFLIQYTSWIYTFYTVHTTKSKLKHWQLGLLSGFIVVGSTILMGLMGLFIKNGL